jgi:hypothetical protein
VTLREWLRGRHQAAPDRLSARVEQALGVRCERDATEAAPLCVDAAEELLRDLLARGSAGRESALDLLAVDALVTYAFEAAGEEPTSLATRALDAMRRLAATTA